MEENCSKAEKLVNMLIVLFLSENREKTFGTGVEIPAKSRILTAKLERRPMARSSSGTAWCRSLEVKFLLGT